METGSAKKNNRISYIKVLIMAVLVIGIGSLPPFGQITPMGMKVLGIFVGCLYGWCVLDILWVSIFSLIAIGMTCSTVLGAFGVGWSNMITLMALITSLIGGAMSSCKITDLFCNWCITRKIVKGRPWMLLAMILIAGALVGAFASSVAGTILLWAVILKLADMCGYKKGCKEIAFLMAMVVIVPAVASNCIPFQPGALFFNSFLMQAIGSTVPFGKFLLYQTIIHLITFVLTVLFAKYIWKLDLSRFNISDEMREEILKQPITYEQKVGLIAIIIFFFALLLPGILPKTIPGMAFLSQLGIVGVGGIMLIVLFIMRNSEGKSLIDINECHKFVPWSVLWLMAAIAPLSDALKSTDTGIMATVTAYAMPMFQNMSLTVFFIGATVILALLTQVSVNMVLGAVFIPFLCGICVELGGNPYTLFMMLYAGINMAFMTPAASAYGGLVHGHEWIKGKNAYITAGVSLAILLMILSVIGLPLGNMLLK